MILEPLSGTNSIFYSNIFPSRLRHISYFLPALFLVFGCMWKTKSLGNLAEPIDEIKCFLLETRRLQQEKLRAMVTLKIPIKDNVNPMNDEPRLSKVRPTMAVNNFELKPSLISMV